jgi:dynein heavy chain 1
VLEKINFQTGDIIKSISDLQDCKSKVKIWSVDMERLKDGQKLLERQKYHFPNDWLYHDKVESEWKIFMQILSKKTAAFDEEADNLKSMLDGQEDLLNRSIKEIENIWNDKKPFRGDLAPKEATHILNEIAKKLEDVTTKADELNRAKELMSMDTNDYPEMRSIKDQIQDYLDVWTDLANIWGPIEQMGDTSLIACQPLAMMRTLDKILEDMNGLPNKYRSLEPFTAKKE